MKRKIVVLGATGTVGSKIAENLLNDGHQVALIARHTDKLEKYRSLGAEIIAGDITDVMLGGGAQGYIDYPFLNK